MWGKYVEDLTLKSIPGAWKQIRLTVFYNSILFLSYTFVRVSHHVGHCVTQSLATSQRITSDSSSELREDIVSRLHNDPNLLDPLTQLTNPYNLPLFPRMRML